MYRNIDIYELNCKKMFNTVKANYVRSNEFEYLGNGEVDGRKIY